ncbi:unnamed protein product [Rhizophagus irregularis]|uniref:Uncharacterized protein n=1 Tax=Rhizophagus irregularis TaxID=588596 RepID=A0A916DY30_9GLOM|nr:unnamed protein product [Rhizophagus irregularis]CAB5308485.1 unnamed protein product [Rhizophagus irregularis]
MNIVNAFHSKSYKFSIPQNINDFSNSSNQNYDNTSKSSGVSKVFNNLKINSKNDIFKEDAINQQIKRQDRDVNDMQIEEFAFEQSVSQTEQITIIGNKNEGKGKSKRIYSEDEKEDSTDNNKSKKIKLNINKANFQYIQRNYIADDDENDISNNPNLHSEDQDEFDIPEDGFE